MNINKDIFRAYDIRGIYPDDLNEETFLLIGKAIGKQIAEQSDDPKVSICMDGRISGPSLKQSLISGLTFMGVNVIDIGSLPTPLLYYSLKKLNINNGLMITGSHNPSSYNGIKMVINNKTLFDNHIIEIYKSIVSDEFKKNKVEGKLIIDDAMLDNYIKNIDHLDPDILFFAGDQSYDHKEHTAAWLKFGIQFREIFRDRPCITIPDDHDIGQGNLWGENGKIASYPAGNDGGYFYDKDYVKMVERAQTNHLPDPYDNTPIDQGIGVYYTNLQLGGIDFAIIEDRKFKSGPNGKIPQQGPRPDHIRNPDYDPSSIDLDNLVLLGERQLKFLEEWGKNENFMMKAVLSQTGFCGGAHLHGKKENRLHADLDSNGWPQKGRNKALKLIKEANAVHIAGDQHLPTVIHHGIKEYEDGPWAFVVPAIINNYYSRWWWPEDEKKGLNGNNILPWTGRYKDGFDNKITMHAYANPDSNSNGAGYGIIKFNKRENNVTFECWPRFVDVSLENSKQFDGWPVTVFLD